LHRRQDLLVIDIVAFIDIVLDVYVILDIDVDPLVDVVMATDVVSSIARGDGKRHTLRRMFLHSSKACLLFLDEDADDGTTHDQPLIAPSLWMVR
jgi:hypothetical protein